MRDGSLICIGKGNKDWNYSAPHGAGRLMSRAKAKEVITLKEFKESMKGIYSTTVNKSTIDDVPWLTSLWRKSLKIFRTPLKL